MFILRTPTSVVMIYNPTNGNASTKFVANVPKNMNAPIEEYTVSTKFKINMRNGAIPDRKPIKKKQTYT